MYVKAIEMFEQASTIAEEDSSLIHPVLGDQKSLQKSRVDKGKACLNLGICYEQLGQYDTSVKLLKEAKAIAEEVHDLSDKCE